MSDSNVTCIRQKRLVRLFKDSINHNRNQTDGIRFCFLIGAGASKDSGIQTGAELASRWYKEIREDFDDEPEEFAKWKQQHKIDESDLASSYPQIFEERFSADPKAGYDELQHKMHDVDPSIGYLILARILAETRHNFVITTNFDHLLEDALFTATTEHPLICGHESLAQYIQSQSQRPTLIKVHRDLLLTPFNKAEDTDRLKNEWEAALAPVLKDFRLVVIGYGGNDGSLMDYLSAIPEQQRQKIFWCVRNPSKVNDKVHSVLKDQDTLVKIDGFEELMYELNSACELESFIDNDNIEESQLIKNARKKAELYRDKLNQLAAKASERSKQGTEPSEALKKILPNWWDYESKASKESDPDKKDAIYQEGMQSYPKSHELIGNYANFLHYIRKSYDKAEKHYLIALDADSEHANNNNNYATLLYSIRKDYDKAEKLYLKAIGSEPEHTYSNGNYAVLLENIHKDYDKAEEYYLKALDADPEYVIGNGNYATFLKDIRKDYNKAEKHYLKALDADPEDAINNGNYALFLNDIREDYDKAEKHYLKALDADPEDADWNGNYAGFLLSSGRAQEGLIYLGKAFSLQPNNDLLSELWFYKLAHFPEEADMAIKALDKLLQEGPSSPGWDFSGNIERAKQEGCEYIDMLEDYAERITKVD